MASESTTITPAAIIGIIIGVLFIIAVVSFGMGIIGLFKPVIDEGSINSFNELSKKIDSLIKDDRVFINNFKAPLPYYLMNGVILVGYNYNEVKQHTACTGESASRPTQILGKAGLCLHVDDNSNDFDSDPQPPIQCYSFDQKVIFLAPSDGSYKGGFGGESNSKNVYGLQEQYEDLFLYGSECSIGEPNLGATKLYIEKYKKGDVTYIYIDEYDPDNKENQERIKERIDRIDKLIKK